MKFQDVQKIAKGMGINTFKMKKVDIIKTIQREEGNFDCFATERVTSCGEESCLWRSDCQTVQPEMAMAHN